MKRFWQAVATMILFGTAPVGAQTPLGTAFAYQGRLDDGGSPANGSYDFQFILYDAAVGGSQVGPIVTHQDLAVTDGLFTVALDFAAAFAGSKRWLDIGVRPGTSTGAFSILAPRQELTPTPAAVFSAAAPWSGVSGKPAGFADDIDNDSGGTVTSVTAGTGLSGGTITTAGTLAVSFGGSGGSATAARSDHNHDGAYAGAVHNHLGESWTGSPATGLEVSTSGATGIRSLITGGTGVTRAVWGESASTNGQGVFGFATATTGLSWGVYGTSMSTSGVGVAGVVGASATSGVGVFGQNNSTTAGTGVFGRGASYGIQGNTINGTAIFGFAEGTTGANYGVYGRTDSTSGRAVFGWASNSLSGTSYAIYGTALAPAAWAGYFEGRLHVTGMLSKGGGSFKIDHPLDPENKYLYHSFVESPDMMNVYNGNVTTDPDGYATVELPEWFEALNKDFRYQLTVLDEGESWVFAKIARKVDGNRFTLRTSVPRVEVSWQVTGIRKDPFAEKHRVPVEEAKAPDERGTYLHPEAWGQPKEKGLDERRRPKERPAPLQAEP